MDGLTYFDKYVISLQIENPYDQTKFIHIMVSERLHFVDSVMATTMNSLSTLSQAAYICWV